MQTPLFRLGPAELVQISGADAIAFANGQFSNDVRALAVGHWQWNAWLDPQGRVRNFFALLRPGTDLLLAWLGPGNAIQMCSQLTPYVMRSKVIVTALTDWQVSALPFTESDAEAIAPIHDGWSFALPGPRQVLLAPGVLAPPASQQQMRQWQLADISAGLPWLHSSLAGELTAPALDLADLGATSLSKGCYPGQEIVARLHYRGGNKRHAWRVCIQSDPTPTPGASILGMDPSSQAGRLLYATSQDDGSCEGLAVLSDPVDTDSTLQLESGARVKAISRVGAPAP